MQSGGGAVAKNVFKECFRTVVFQKHRNLHIHIDQLFVAPTFVPPVCSYFCSALPSFCSYFCSYFGSYVCSCFCSYCCSAPPFCLFLLLFLLSFLQQPASQPAGQQPANQPPSLVSSAMTTVIQVNHIYKDRARECASQSASPPSRPGIEK